MNEILKSLTELVSIVEDRISSKDILITPTLLEIIDEAKKIIEKSYKKNK